MIGPSSFLPAIRCLVALALLAPVRAQGTVSYTIKVSKPAERRATAVATVPVEGTDGLEVYLPVWSPGFYRVENHAERVIDLAVVDAEGKRLKVTQPKPGRWRIATGKTARVVVTYTLDCSRPSVTRNQVEEGFAVFCGPATFLAVAGAERRRAEVQFEVPAAWPHTATALPPAASGRKHHFAAHDYDSLCDAPIVLGTISTDSFDVLGCRHELSCFGAVSDWNGALATRRLQPVTAELCRMFGAVPFERYLFLNGFRGTNGGIEHRDSALITTSPRQQPDDLGWLSAVAREYCQAFNGKRLRPVELGPFDYENQPSTSSLWITEGFTSYLTDLACVRTGAASRAQWLGNLSAQIRSLQSIPGRRVQTLAESSTRVWTNSLSGIGGDARLTVSYLAKGPVVAFLLDARLRARTDGRHGLDTLMRQAYARWSGERGFQPQEFEAIANDLAGVSLRPFFARAVYSTEELDYREVLLWFGLRFRAVVEGAPASERWTLEVLPEATEEQAAHLKALLQPTPLGVLQRAEAPASGR